jgi:hypothetical protein
MSIRGFIDRLTGKSKWVPPQGNGLEHDDWQRGDLAVRIAKGEWYGLEDGRRVAGPEFGELLRVSCVRMDQGWHILAFEGTAHFWTAECFRKVRPQQREACDQSFIRKMKGIRPKVGA